MLTLNIKVNENHWSNLRSTKLVPSSVQKDLMTNPRIGREWGKTRMQALHRYEGKAKILIQAKLHT
jgi:hypothetical protein